MTAPRAGMPGQQQQGWVQMPVPSDAQIQQHLAQQQRPLNAQQAPQLQSPQYAQMQQQGLGQQPQMQQQQPQYQMAPTQVMHSQEPFSQTPAPNLQPQPQQQQQPQMLPPSQQQPYLTNQQMAQQPQYAQQPQMQQPQQMGQQQAGGIRLDANGRVAAQPGIPQELIGRPLNDVFAIYNMMRQAYVESQLQPQVPQQQYQQQQPQQQQQAPRQPVSQQVPGQAKASDFWSDPIGTMERIIEKKIQPVTQETVNRQIQEARNQAATIAPDFAQFEAGVIARLRGQPAEVLANPGAWQYAYYIEKGEQQLRQNNQTRNGFQQVGGNQQHTPGWQPPVGAFFSESPTPPQADDLNAQQQLSPEEMAMAQKFGRSPQEWLAAKQGRF